MLKWTLIVLISLASIAGFGALVGSMLPKGHRASRTATIAAAPEVVFGVITDFARASEWRRDVKKVDVLPDDGRGRIVREHGKQGVVPYRVEVLESPKRLVMRIADPSLPYGGSWTYELRDAGAGTDITITEDGEVFNPIFRVMQKFFFSPYATIDAYLEDLRKRVGS
jgi:hypothetical protein